MRDPALPSGAEPAALVAVGAPHDPGEPGLDRPLTGIGGAPAWQRDVLSVSARVRAIVATLRPLVVRALTFWDHAARSIRIGARTLDVDPSGSYRLR
ncbi:MAG TPA: hypothetical protein VGN14_16910 [Candidatus Elarobacter sp.]|jgi:hypothetical protein